MTKFLYLIQMCIFYSNNCHRHTYHQNMSNKYLIFTINNKYNLTSFIYLSNSTYAYCPPYLSLGNCKKK